MRINFVSKLIKFEFHITELIYLDGRLFGEFRSFTSRWIHDFLQDDIHLKIYY